MGPFVYVFGIFVDSWEEMLFRVAVPYECLFDPSEVLLGIFTAMPLNIFFTLAIAHASANFLGSYYDAIFFLRGSRDHFGKRRGLFSRCRLDLDSPYREMCF
jgi:hypothetical protein